LNTERRRNRAETTPVPPTSQLHLH
jgi:hypothetical protein